LKRDGTRWRTGGEVKGKLAMEWVATTPALYLGTWSIHRYYPIRTPQRSVVDWTDSPPNLNGLVRFAERPNLVAARVPSHFKRSLHTVSTVH
jgi:hypothetical protein